MPRGRREGVGGDARGGQQLDLIEPGLDGTNPVCSRLRPRCERLVEVLPDGEPPDSTTLGAVVGKVALVRQSLGDAGQLGVPLQLTHVCRWWKPRQPTCNAAAESVVMVDNLQ